MEALEAGGLVVKLSVLCSELEGFDPMSTRQVGFALASGLFCFLFPEQFAGHLEPALFVIDKHCIVKLMCRR